jgi:hypothetical protein
MYGTSCNYLYEIDPDTGEQEQIGPLSRDPLCMIGLAFDSEGILYGWDEGDYLWTIDPETGEATELGPLGINVTGYDSGDYCYLDDNLYLIASGHLYSCNKYTAECTLIGDFEEDIEITACMIIWYWGPEKDVGIYSINSPDTGYAGSNMSMQVTVKNFGNSTLTTDVQMIVDKYNVGSVILDEDFSSAFPPEGWETDFWNKSYTDNAGGNAPEAQVYKYDQYNESQYYDNYITSAPIDCTNVDKVNVKFNWAADYDYPQYCNVYIKFRGNTSEPWTDVTPWDNPVGND